MDRWGSLTAALAVSVGIGTAAPEVKIQAGAKDRFAAVASIPLDFERAFPDEERDRVVLFLTDGDRKIPGQWMPSDVAKSQDTYIFQLNQHLAAGESKTYGLLCESADSVETPFVIERAEGDYTVLLDRSLGKKRPILRYNQGIQRNPHGPTHTFLDRSGYVHPLWTPQGHVVTGDFCVDHPHQRGLFFAWTNCTFRGEAVNFWEMRTGTSQTVSPPEIALGSVAAVVTARNRLLAGERRDRPAIRETLTYHVYGEVAGGWLIDLTVDHAAIGEPLHVEKYHYGGMAFRGPAAWLETPLGIRTSEGIEGRRSDRTRAGWCEMSGPAPGGSQMGVTYFDSPENPRYPTHLRMHPDKPYFCIAYQQREGVHIDAAHPLRLRYRILVHDGRPAPDTLDAIAAGLLEPLVIDIKYP